MVRWMCLIPPGMVAFEGFSLRDHIELTIIIADGEDESYRELRN
jgi:hypothetical protein